MNIYIGNMSLDTTTAQLTKAFEVFGKISTINVIKDKYSGDLKGFAFVEMAKKNEANAAIDGLNGKDLNGNVLTVNEAKPRSNSGGGYSAKGNGYRKSSFQ